MPSYEADLSRFEERDTHVLGISIDSVPCNKAWAKSLGGISYDLLSDFELPSHNGNKVKLSDFRGKKNVFIAFYPLAWTPV